MCLLAGFNLCNQSAAGFGKVALIDNGGLSGQVQYRGLFGDRVLIRINGQRFHGGGPNAMDPPLHYAPMPLIGSVEVDRGISPVRNGPGLAGGVNARLKQVDFGEELVCLSLDVDIGGGSLVVEVTITMVSTLDDVSCVAYSWGCTLVAVWI